VKKLLAITTLLCAVCAFAGGAYASAETGETFYPESFTEYVDGNVTGISDFAIGENCCAVADGNKIIVVNDGVPSFFTADSAVTALDCKNEENGCVFLFKDGENAVYSLLLPEKQPAEHTFPEVKDVYTTADGEYKLLKSGGVYFCPADDTVYQKITGEGESFHLIKQFGGVIYGACGNGLYKFDKTQAEKLTLDFTDFSSANSIPIGNTLQKLRGFNTETPGFVALKDGAYLTEIDLNATEQTYFKAGRTYKTGTDEGFTAGKSAILLCLTGKDDEVSLVAFGGKTYIMRTENTSVIQKTALTATEFNRATVSIASASAYSSPLVSNGTKLFALEAGTEVKVLGKITSASAQEVNLDFYLIEYTQGEASQKGYVPFGYISEFTYVEEDPHQTTDPEASEDNLVTTVVLILLVILLVLIAVGYLVWIATSKKHGAKESK